MNNSVLRSLTILKLLADASGPQRLRDICAATGIPKSTALGILRALVEERFAETDAAGYRLGLRAFEVGAAYVRGVSPSAAVQPELARLVGELQATAHFAVLDGADVLYLDKEDPPDAEVRLASAVGRRLPAHYTAVGQAQLAQLGDADLSEHMGPGPFTVRDGLAPWTLAELRSRLTHARRLGYALDDGDTLEHVQCVAAAVFDASSRCCGAIGASYLKRRDGLTAEQAAAAVTAAARRASERLGFRHSGDAA